MENISQYRDNLDKTLMSSDLSNVESVKTLVENQMSKSTQSEDQGFVVSLSIAIIDITMYKVLFLVVKMYINFSILYYVEYREVLVQKRTKEVANLLSMLRSASGKATEELKANEIPHGGWKVCFVSSFLCRLCWSVYLF